MIIQGRWVIYDLQKKLLWFCPLHIYVITFMLCFLCGRYVQLVLDDESFRISKKASTCQFNMFAHHKK